MKKISMLLTILFVAALFAIANEKNENLINETSDAYLIAQAEIELSNCHEEAGVIKAFVRDGYEKCENGQRTKVVTLWSSIPCPPGSVCTADIDYIGSVTFDCNGMVIEVECGQ